LQSTRTGARAASAVTLKRSEVVKRLVVISILLLLVLSVFIFPFDRFGSSVFYISLAFFTCALFAASWKGGTRKGWAYLGLSIRRMDVPLLLFQSVLLLIACGITTVAMSGIFYLAGMLDTQAVYEKMIMLPLPALIAAFTIAPLGEEALFRGLLFRKFGEWLGKGKDAWIGAAVVSSLIFALLHMSYGSVAEIGVAFSIGFVLCIGTRKFNSLVPAVLAHAAFNFASIVMAVFL